MKVREVGYITQASEIILLRGRTHGDIIPADILAVLTNNRFTPEVPTTALVFALMIGEGAAAKEVKLQIEIATQVLNTQHGIPTVLAWSSDVDGYLGIFLYRNEIFGVKAPYLQETTEEEAILLIKKHAFSKDARLNRLRREVETMERVVNDVGIKRIAIPENVKLLVYNRDEGKCVRCGSSQNLHFDHIIPVAKGGGISENNIQLLCEYCNLQKSDRIAF